MTRKEVLETAIKCTNGDRDEQYGKPEDSFMAIAALWDAYLKVKNPGKLTDADAAIMMALMKIGRIATGNFKEDSYIDACGYLACAAELEMYWRTI